MIKKKLYKFTGINAQAEKVKGEVSAYNSLEAIRVLKYEMSIAVILSIKESRKNLLDIAKIVSGTKNKKHNKQEDIRKVTKIIKKKPEFDKVKQLVNNVAIRAGNAGEMLKSKRIIVLDNEELDRAVKLASESIFKSIEEEKGKKISGINQAASGGVVTEKVVYVDNNPSSTLSNYLPVAHSKEGLGGDIKETLKKRKKTEKVKMDWSVVEKSKPKATSKIKLKELVLFSHKMAILLRAGLMLLDALYIVKESFKRKVVIKTIDGLINKVEGGTSLSEAMEEYPYIFDEFYIAVIKVGESIGGLASSFEDLTKAYKTRLTVKKKAKTASMYPLITLGILVTMLLAASKFFLPMFRGMFEQMGTELPAITRFVFDLSDNIPKIIMWIAIAVSIHILLYKTVRPYNKYLNVAKDFMMANTPVLKKYTQIISLYNFSSTMQIMLKNGIGLVDALELSIKVVQNIIYKVQIGSLKINVIDGLGFAESATKLDKMDQFTISMIRIGEESGNMGAAFQNINEYQQESLKEYTDIMTELMQPIIMLLLAAVVTPIIIAIYLPLMQMSSGSGIAL